MAYPSDVKDEAWTFVAPYWCLMNEAPPQRDYALRDVFNALRYLAHTSGPWRYLPGDLPRPRFICSGRAGGAPAYLNLSCMT
jgi:transposase